MGYRHELQSHVVERRAEVIQTLGDQGQKAGWNFVELFLDDDT
jgi:hypothetical protein